MPTKTKTEIAKESQCMSFDGQLGRWRKRTCKDTTDGNRSHTKRRRLQDGTEKADGTTQPHSLPPAKAVGAERVDGSADQRSGCGRRDDDGRRSRRQNVALGGQGAELLDERRHRQRASDDTRIVAECEAAGGEKDSYGVRSAEWSWDTTTLLGYLPVNNKRRLCKR